MKRLPNGRVGRVLMGAAVLAVLATACSTETPTAPVQVPAPVITALVANFTCAVTGPAACSSSTLSRLETRPPGNGPLAMVARASKQDPVHTYRAAVPQ